MLYSYSLVLSRHPEFSQERVRIDSFSNWYLCSESLNAATLAEAGLFYCPENGRVDCARCFHCGLMLTEWIPTDKPLIEHIRWSFNCDYLFTKFGRDFIVSEFRKTFTYIPPSLSDPASHILNKNFFEIPKDSYQDEICDGDLLCKICYKFKINT